MTDPPPAARPPVPPFDEETWAENRIAVRFQYEWRDEAGRWWRSYGNENWEFDADGYMQRRAASINDVAIAEPDRRIVGPGPTPSATSRSRSGRRPDRYTQTDHER